MNYDFDLFVIGAGSGGVASARRAAEYGAKVGIAEFDSLGGTCVNRGCVPKKLMVYASHFPETFQAASGYGWTVGESSFDWQSMITAVNNEVNRLAGVYQRLLDKSGVKIFRGYGSFIDEHTVAIGDEKVTAEKILIAVGGKPVKPDSIPGIEHAITSREIFHVQKQPQHIVVLGGGYIGTEFACILKGLGSKVTQVIRGDKILRGFDEDIRSEIQDQMISHGVEIKNKVSDLAIAKTGAGLEISFARDGQKETLVADSVSLAATGRKPRLEKLGLENTQVETKNGAVAVDEYNKTSVDHIYAVGDCTARIELTPVAIKEGRAFADTHFGGQSKQMAYDNVPTAIFTTPEAATVGMTETEARARYGSDAIKVYRSRFRPMYYSLPDMQVKTLMKLIVDINTDKVLGAHMVGDAAAEIIQGIAIAVKMGATKAQFDATVAIHPSSAEEFVTMR